MRPKDYTVAKRRGFRDFKGEQHYDTRANVEIVRRGIIAGVAGGLAEVAWVSVYAIMTGGDAAVLARGVTTAAGGGPLLPSSPVALGVAVHMLLAVTLGIALTAAWTALRNRQCSPVNPYSFMLTALAGVWAMNFFVILPLVSPGFVHIVPYAVSLTSKVLFGVAAAEAVRRQEAPPSRLAPVPIPNRIDCGRR
jgi:hypothetical protein